MEADPLFKMISRNCAAIWAVSDTILQGEKVGNIVLSSVNRHTRDVKPFAKIIPLHLSTLCNQRGRRKKKLMMSNETIKVLKNAGWYEGRNIDTKETEKKLEKLGFIVYPEVKKFLLEFGDLVIEDTINDEIHNTSVNFRGQGAFKAEEKYAQENLVPVGFIDSGHLVLFISESGKVYCSTGKLGDNAAEAWGNLIEGKGFKPWK